METFIRTSLLALRRVTTRLYGSLNAAILRAPHGVALTGYAAFYILFTRNRFDLEYTHFAFVTRNSGIEIGQ